MYVWSVIILSLMWLQFLNFFEIFINTNFCNTQVVRLMVPMLKFYFHDGVRTAAAESLPFLLECAKIKGPQYLAEMWQYICPELLKAIETEPENEVGKCNVFCCNYCKGFLFIYFFV